MILIFYISFYWRFFAFFIIFLFVALCVAVDNLPTTFFTFDFSYFSGELTLY